MGSSNGATSQLVQAMASFGGGSGVRLESEKRDGERVYRIVAGNASGDAASVPSA